MWPLDLEVIKTHTEINAFQRLAQSVQWYANKMMVTNTHLRETPAATARWRQWMRRKAYRRLASYSSCFQAMWCFHQYGCAGVFQLRSPAGRELIAHWDSSVEPCSLPAAHWRNSAHLVTQIAAVSRKWDKTSEQIVVIVCCAEAVACLDEVMLTTTIWRWLRH